MITSVRVWEVLGLIVLIACLVGFVDHIEQRHEQVLMQQIDSANAQHQADIKALQEQNVALSQQVANYQQQSLALQAQALKAIASIKTLQPSQVAQQTQQQVQGSVVTQGSGELLDQQAAQEVLGKLIQLQADTQQLELDKEAFASLQQKEYNEEAVVVQVQAIEANDKLALKACQASVSRAKRKAFVIGLGVGWVAGFVTHHFIGLP